MAEQKQKNKVGYPADEVGNRLHTAMRKLMDSQASSYAWNVVHLLDETWALFCAAVAETEARTGPELQAVFDDYAKWWPYSGSWSGPKPTKEKFYAAQIFRIALEDFDERDWEDLGGYLDPEYDV